MKDNESLKTIILASQSPRRAEILKNAGYYFVSFPVHISEIPNENLSLDEQILDIARRKAKACYRHFADKGLDSIKNEIIIASDTMVCLDSKAIGKPSSELEAFEILKSLSGREHLVKTAVVIVDLETKETLTHIETSEVYFKKLSDEGIRNYIKTGEPMDKAGAYAIQGLGQQFVDKYIGDYNNVVGLPLYAIEKIFSFKNWNFKKNIQKRTPLQIIKSQLKADQNLLAVSKHQPLEKIRALYSEGQSHFGENYIQEALEKIEQTQDLYIKWHLIGPIQKNKVKFLKNHFEYIHSVDSFELAELINKKAKEIHHVQKVFLQVNLSHEASKSGYDEADLLNDWPRLKVLENLNIIGLMTMPPLQNKPDENRIYFKNLKKLAGSLHLTELSMGTSHDYKIALEEKATWIRIGTVLFGERQNIK